jgi:hypothetical protein
MKRQGKMLLITAMALCLTLLVAPAALAGERGEEAREEAQERHVVTNAQAERGGPPGPEISFEEFVASLEEGDSCSGVCDCFTCLCSGSLGCCLGGCDACFEVACGAV